MLDDELVITSEMEGLVTEATRLQKTVDRELDTIGSRYMELALQMTFALATAAADRCIEVVEAGNVTGERLSEMLRERGPESFLASDSGRLSDDRSERAELRRAEEPSPFFMRRLIEVIEHVRDFVELYLDVRGLDDDFIPWLGQYSRSKTWSVSSSAL